MAYLSLLGLIVVTFSMKLFMLPQKLNDLADNWGLCNQKAYKHH